MTATRRLDILAIVGGILGIALFLISASKMESG